MSPTKLPAQLGFSMPAEWQKHTATWLAWPHNRADWPGKFPPIPWIYADIVRLLAQGEDVHILVPDKTSLKTVEKILVKNAVTMARVHLHALPTDRVWTRDSGPIFVTRQEGKKNELAVTDWKFNAWAKYDNWKHDDKIPAYVARKLKLNSWQPQVCVGKKKLQRMVLEGGSIDVNGAGTLLTTEECLLSPIQARNPGATRTDIEAALADYLGIEQVLWLDRGIAGDDTHGHIDDTARFVNSDTIVCCMEANQGDDNHAPMQDNLQRLRQYRTLDGKPWNIVELPMPQPVVFDGQRLPASYANFYIANAGVLVPVFNDPYDRLALDILQECFPDRPVVPVYCRDLVWGLGTLHCMTQQQPAIA